MVKQSKPPETDYLGIDTVLVENIISGKEEIDFLLAAFVWEETTQGHDYWSDIVANGELDDEAIANLRQLLLDHQVANA